MYPIFPNSYRQILIVFCCLVSVVSMYGQTNKVEDNKAKFPQRCRNIYVWDFEVRSLDTFSAKEKKENTYFCETVANEVEAAFAKAKEECEECVILERREFATIARAVENERDIQIDNGISLEESKKIFGDKLAEVVVYGTIEDIEGTEDSSELTLKFISLKKQNLGGHTFTIYRNQKNRDKRRDAIRRAVMYDVLGFTRPTPAKLIPSKKSIITNGIGTGIGILGLGTGLLLSSNLKRNWDTYIKDNPTDTQGNYAKEDKKYVTYQVVAIGGGILSLIFGSYLDKALTKRQEIKSDIEDKAAKAAFTPFYTPKKNNLELHWATDKPLGLYLRF